MLSSSLEAALLVAGKGTRLYPYTEDRPKCLLEINGVSILERSLHQLKACGVSKCVVVAGYHAELVEELVEDLRPSMCPMEVMLVVNPIYYKTGTIYSLWLAQKDLSSPFLVVEGDVVCDTGLMKALASDPRSTLLVLDDLTVLGDEEMKVIMDGERIHQISKDLVADECQAEFIGLAKFGRQDGARFLEAVDARVRGGSVKEFYEAALQDILQEIQPGILMVGDHRWTEIDYIEEYQKARLIFLDEAVPARTFDLTLFEGTSHSPSVSALAGGFEASNIRDFCYLGNPYFPTKSMINELMLPFVTLIKHYPSENPRVSNLVAQILGVDPQWVVVGNGASELITFINRLLVRSLTVPIPTFSEYLETMEVQGKPVATLSLREGQRFTLDPEVAIKTIRRNGSNAFVLINPNNPTGSFLEEGGLIQLLEGLRALDLVIIDESFVDFAARDQIPSAVAWLLQYPNLLIVKSLGKCYGLSGLRLGVAITANRLLVEELREALPVWNINSITEHFLELFPRYAREYEIARRKMIDTTQALSRELERFGALEVFPTRANFVLARLRNGMTSTEFRDYLLTRYNVYVRDCQNKVGLDNTYVRIASRTDQENQELLLVLDHLFEGGFYSR